MDEVFESGFNKETGISGFLWNQLGTTRKRPVCKDILVNRKLLASDWQLACFSSILPMLLDQLVYLYRSQVVGNAEFWELGDAGIRREPPDDSEAGRSPEAHPKGIGN
jgi:hypothetical protein